MPEPVVRQPDTWTAAQLTELKELNVSFKGDVTEVASLIGRDRMQCDIALFSLLGRSVAETEIYLNARAPRLAA